MNGMEAIAAISASGVGETAALSQADTTTATTEINRPGFSDLITEGLAQVEARIDHADEMVRAFTLDSSVPVHQVTIALEEARLAVELALQVRTRVTEAYREVMNMQL